MPARYDSNNDQLVGKQGGAIAWDTERTKMLLLGAATTEFSMKGLAGARVDRIASEAGVNKERIYQYFGSKNGLFDAVLAAELGRVMIETPIHGAGPEAVGAYAGRLFDRHKPGSLLPRLTFWEGLERGDDVVDRETRAGNCALAVDRVIDVLPGIERADAADLLLTTLTLCDGWSVLHQLDGLLTAGTDTRREQRRSSVVRSVTLLAEFLQGEAPVTERLRPGHTA